MGSSTSRSHPLSSSESDRPGSSSTALEFVRALRRITDQTRLTTVVSIYQAGEPLYELFDKVCVIYEGRMAYFGPANRARQYFVDMGYTPAHRQTTADFLVAGEWLLRPWPADTDIDLAYAQSRTPTGARHAPTPCSLCHDRRPSSRSISASRSMRP